MPKNELSDDDLALSMLVFMEEHGEERMLRAMQAACMTISEKAGEELDGTSRDVWKKAGELVGQAAEHLENN